MIINWLRHVQDVCERHQHLFTRGMNDAQAADRLGELNVLEQVANVCRTTIVQDAWRRGQRVAIHGWIYGLKDGIVNDLGLYFSRADALQPEYDQALAAIASKK